MESPTAFAKVEIRPRKLPKIETGNEIVISGMAGRFPESDNVTELLDNLLNKRDLVTDNDDRWNNDIPEIPKRTGKVKRLDKFDALFFGVHYKQAHIMDPMARILLEHTYEAIVDAGINPQQIRGTRTGVFVGTSFCESEKTWLHQAQNANGFGITGCARSMFSNRISFWLGLNGPSYTIDSACSSSLYALEHAYRAIIDGFCDAAIVGTSNLCLNPYMSLQFFKLGVLSNDCRCKVFDEAADGYARGEAISVVFLQKAKDAKRVYATLVHGKTNCDGYKEQGITFPSSSMQKILLKEFYIECGLPPTVVNYVEAHGTGTQVGDPEEVNAIDEIFCPGRKSPLKIGSVKSNLGHSEPASGLTSVIKVLLAMESGIIPPNLNFENPRKCVKSLVDGTIKVVTEPTPWDGGYAAINSFGFGGANAHILLKSFTKEKINNGAPNDNLPRLVPLSGRTEEAITTIINYLSSRSIDAEYIGLLHNIYSEDIKNHLYRGYTILPPRKVSEKPLQEIAQYSDTKRPIWFVYSGIGSQWPGMGEALLQVPVFADAIKKCDTVLKPHGIDIFHIITNKEKTAFDSILNSFVGIAACQIGLTDILRVLGIKPDYIIGHSVGELGCAYADECFTTEQMILAAFSRGLASIESQFIHGSMAAIGLGYKDIKNLCPPDITVACHNSAESSTISGPAASMKSFVAELQAKKIFAREVPCSNIPYHSRYIASAGPKLLAYLQKIIPEPKMRSSKWVSTSVPMDKWETPLARYSSAEYHTNNLLNSVLFEETSALIPENAITIEIAPHGLLQAIIRRSLAPTVTNIALTRRGHANNVEVLLQSIGKMYTVGLQPQIANIYPPIQFPVSRSTPMISPLIKWEHSDDWFVTSFNLEENSSYGQRQVKISINDSEYESMAGHVIDGRNLFPATGYLALVWETKAIMKGKIYNEVSVVFKDVKFLRATPIPANGIIEFIITVLKGTGRFEIVEDDVAIVTGYIYETNDTALEKLNPPILINDKEEESMTTHDIYKELRLRGYYYTGLYVGIASATTSGSRGHLKWSNDWVSFMDSMLQMKILNMDSRSLFVPTGIKQLVIDTKDHHRLISICETEKVFPVYVNKKFDTVVCGGVEIRGLSANVISRKPAPEPTLEEYIFVAHTDRSEVSLEEIARLSTQICLENHLNVKAKIIELIDPSDDISSDNLLSPLIAKSLNDFALIQAEVNIASTKEYKDLAPNVLKTEIQKLGTDTNALLAIGHCLLTEKRTENLNSLLSLVTNNGFVLTRETSVEWNDFEKVAQSKSLDIIFEKKYGNESILLLKKHDSNIQKISIVFVDNKNFSWIEDMKKTMPAVSDEVSSKSDRIIFVGQGDFENGLIGFINCLRKEPGGEICRGILIQDDEAMKFSLENPLYAKQVEKDLAVCVLRKNRVWGSYRHLPLPQAKPTFVQHAIGNQKIRGDLTSFFWHEGRLRPNSKDKNLVKVYYSALNFKDVMLASGKLSVETFLTDRLLQENVLGFEYSGINESGKRVMGVVKSEGLSNLIIEDPLLSWELPKDWSYEDAATVPTVYATCCCALYKYGNMKKGDKVLIHAGSGGVGQAAINLALNEGCEVFTTVGTPQKRQFIRETFPQIPESHIGNSRDTSFEKMILDQTNGQGVDIVLNSLAEEKLQASIRCLALRGRFLEIGKFDLAANNKLGMDIFLREIHFCGVMLDLVFFHGSTAVKMDMWKTMNEKLKTGAIKPLVRTIFPKEEIEAAFRYMAAGKHIGKVLLKIRNEDEPIDSPIKALPQYYCYEDHSYVILGGLGGFGLELADWLILRGARNLVLTSRKGVTNGYQKMRINLWQNYGARIVVVVKKEASKLEDCKYILEAGAALGPVDGVFNLAVVLKDALWSNQTSEAFEELFRCKAWATKNLDILTRKMCPQLRHFVVFSSVSCGRGNGGQTNYGMANSVMERICERRATEGLPALAIQWGAVGDVGLVAEMQGNKEVVIGGTLPQSITSCLQKLDEFMVQNHPIVSSMVVAEKKAAGTKALNVMEAVLNIMNIKDIQRISPTTPLAEIGVDSMMSVEIKQTLQREFQIFLTTQEIQKLNFSKLQEMNAKTETEVKKSEDNTKNIGILQGMKQLVKIIGNQDINPALCLQLPSKEEGRQEIFFIPGIEGLAPIFERLTPHIKAPVTCLQLDLHDNKSILDMSRKFLPHVLKKCKNRRQYRIVGYSYGACIAIELMRMLEAEGIDGRLILVDGAPEHSQSLMNEHFFFETKEELENKLILGIMNMFFMPIAPELIDDLNNCKSWDSKLEVFMSRSPTGALDMSIENQKVLFTAIYARLIALKDYCISKSEPINSPIILLKPTIPSIRGGWDDYGLSKVTSGKVEIQYIDGNHISILDNAKVITIINDQFSEDV